MFLKARNTPSSPEKVLPETQSRGWVLVVRCCFLVCLLLLLKLILSDGLQFLFTKRPFNFSPPQAKLPFAP